jgi:hypothetical protein
LSKPLHQLVAELLSDRAGERLSMSEVARGLVAKHPERFRAKELALGGREQLIDQLTREIYAQRGTIQGKHAEITTDASERPMRLFVDQVPAGEEYPPVSPATEPVSSIEPVTTLPLDDDVTEEWSEHALYGPLQSYLWEGLGVLSKRIREGTSSNKRGRHGNKWLHPDIVGLLAPGHEWSELVRQCAMALPARKAQLVAIEVKRQLTTSTLREAFFQAVSNSLWANKAYLAAVEVKGEDTFNELSMLCSLHGIGYLKIDPNTYSNSQILIPARDRDEVDWASANRIATENKDFREYLKSVLNYLQTGQLMPKLWDATDRGR